ncbi:MAG: hypothetical protein M1819_004922 [Sarea resinae]|nr:MAG: hypothetical protein M1819_004922 [Sarea resinae]
MDGPTRVMEATSVDSSGMNSANHRMQLPSISDMTAGISAHASSNDSHTYAADDSRDSGNWSLQSPSKHSSIVSNGYMPPLNTRNSPSTRNSFPSQGDKSPYTATYSNGPTSSPAQPPNSDQPPSNLPTLSQSYDSQHRASTDYPPQDSRRSSIESRMNSGFGQLAITPSSPYGSTNASQASLVSSLQRERGIVGDQSRSNGVTVARVSSNSNAHLSPLGRGPSENRRLETPRIAPPISSNPRAQYGLANPNAENPTTGFAYAFPDPALAGRSSSSDDADREFSRQGSLANSIGSSLYTNDSRLPAGQRRLDDDLPGVHHHQLQHRQVSEMMSPSSPGGPSPYSRTPELRISHKMAERKRRSEMKGLFEELRLQLPSHQGAKSSKWEILTKATEYIRHMEQAMNRMENGEKEWQYRVRELSSMNEQLSADNERLRDTLQHVQQSVGQNGVPPPPAPMQQQSYQPHPVYDSAPHMQQPPRTTLPPISSSAPSAPPPPPPTRAPPGQYPGSSMQGIQYSERR